MHFLNWSSAGLRSIQTRISDFLFLHDPGYLNFFYSIKTFICSIVCVAICYHLFGQYVVIWAALIPIHFYFLNVTFSNQSANVYHFLSFIGICILTVSLFYVFLGSGYWLMLPVGFMAFLSVMVSVYNPNWQKIMNMAILNGLIGCIYESLIPDFKFYESICIPLIGGGISIFAHFILVRRRHGNFVRGYFPDLFHTLELMLKNLGRDKQFMQYYYKAGSQIEFLRSICNSKNSRANNALGIKNIKRTLFYLYRIHEFCDYLSILRNEGLSSKEYLTLRREIIYNLKQLSDLFREKSIPHLKTQVLDSCECKSSMKRTLIILYNSMKSFKRGGQEEGYFAQVDSKRSLGMILKSFRYQDLTFRYGIKYAVVLMSSIFISEFFHLTHGIWITMGCMAMSKPSLGGVSYLARDYSIGGILGICIAVSLIYFTYPSPLFYMFFLLSGFGCVYFRIYPYGVWSCFIMMEFVMMFSVIYGFSLEIIMDRVFDVGLAFFLCFFGFFFLWPRYSRSEVLPNVKKLLGSLFEFYSLLIDHIESLKSHKAAFRENQKKFFSCYDALSLSIKESRKEKISHFGPLADMYKVLQSLNFLNQRTLKLYYYFQDMQNLDSKEFYVNDLRLIQTRYEMIDRALDNKSFYFKESQDGRFLSPDKEFSEIIDSLFERQNKLFLDLNENIR